MNITADAATARALKAWKTRRANLKAAEKAAKDAHARRVAGAHKAWEKRRAHAVAA